MLKTEIDNRSRLNKDFLRLRSDRCSTTSWALGRSSSPCAARSATRSYPHQREGQIKFGNACTLPLPCSSTPTTLFKSQTMPTSLSTCRTHILRMPIHASPRSSASDSAFSPAWRWELQQRLSKESIRVADRSVSTQFQKEVLLKSHCTKPPRYRWNQRYGLVLRYNELT